MKFNSRRVLIAVAAASALTGVGCTSAGAVVTEPPTVDSSPRVVASIPTNAPSLMLEDDGALAAVSKSRPTAEAAAAMAACHIGDMVVIDKVAGMAKLSAATQLPKFMPLTGREPQLKETGPVWVIQIHGDVQQLGNEIWSDPTCVVTSTDSGYFATGVVTNTETSEKTDPEPPPVAPTKVLPSLAP